MDMDMVSALNNATKAQAASASSEELDSLIPEQKPVEIPEADQKKLEDTSPVTTGEVSSPAPVPAHNSSAGQGEDSQTQSTTADASASPVEKEQVKSPSVSAGELDMSSFAQYAPQTTSATTNIVASGNLSFGLTTVEQQRIQELERSILALVLPSPKTESIHNELGMVSPSLEIDEEKKLRNIVFKSLDARMLREEAYLLYRVVVAKRRGDFTPSKNFIVTHYRRNSKELREANNANYITLDRYGSEDGSVGDTYLRALEDFYDDVVDQQGVLDTEGKLYSALEEFRELYLKASALDALAQTAKILSDEGARVKGVRGVAQGFADASNFVRKSLTDMELLTDDTTAAERYISLADFAKTMDDEADSARTIKLGDFGDVDELNQHYGGLYTGNLMTVLAPPKSGKSKFTNRLTYNVLMQGHNVSALIIEGGADQFVAQLRAIHFAEWLKREKPEFAGKYTGVNQDVILNNKWDENPYLAQFKQWERVSFQDLIVNPKYGSLSLIQGTVTAENFLQTIEESVRINDSQMVYCDYLQMIFPQDASVPQHQALTRVYKDAADFAHNNNVLFLSPAQMNQSSVKDSLKNPEIDLRTSGAGSAEVIRSSEILLALVSDTETIKSGHLKVIGLPSRFAQPLGAFMMYSDLETCYFSSDYSDS